MDKKDMTNIRSEFNWFKNNITLLVDDVLFEDSGNDTELYFDTVDVTNSILGMYAFYTPNSWFDRNEFENRNTLIQCLAASGWLGQIRMFPPHQAELLNHIEHNFGLGPPVNPIAKANQLLIDIAVSDEIYKKYNIESMANNELADFVKQQAGKAQIFFKAIQSIRHGTWQGRLKYMRSNNILKFEYSNYDYKKLIDSQLFYRLKAQFDKKRPATTKNNFADAAVLSMMLEMVEKYNNGISRKIPLFFMSKPIFIDVIKDAELYDLFSIKTKDIEPKCVLRDTDYFIFRCTFKPFSTMNDKSTYATNPLRRDELFSLNSALKEIEKTNQLVTSEMLERSKIGEKNILELINDLKSYTFLENVWLRVLAEEDVKKAQIEITQIAIDERVQKKVKEFIYETKKVLRSNVEEYQNVSSLTIQLKNEIQILKNKVKVEHLKKMDILRDMGIIRFALNRRSNGNIAEIVRAIISSEEETENDAIRLVLHCIFAIQNTDNEENLVNISTVLGIFWVTEMDNAIIGLLNKYKNIQHFSLDIVFAASIFRLKKNITKGIIILRKLKREFDTETNMGQKSDMAVGIAYLYFHLWQAKGFRPVWRDRGIEENEARQRESARIIENAAKYAKYAFSSLSFSPQKKVYALNQYLYYLVEGGNEKQWNEMVKIAKTLSSYKQDAALWQYRYDDTLARYFHRAAIIAQGYQEKRDFIEIAWQHIKTAKDQSYGDSEIDSYYSEVCADRTGILIGMI